MRRLSLSIPLGIAISLMVLVGLTGSAVAASPTQMFTVGSVGYTANSNATESRLEAFSLNWTGYRPDKACISVWNSGGSSSVANVCNVVAKGPDAKFPQNMYVTDVVAKTQLSSGIIYKLRVDLVRKDQILASSDFYTITAGPYQP